MYTLAATSLPIRRPIVSPFHCLLPTTYVCVCDFIAVDHLPPPLAATLKRRRFA